MTSLNIWRTISLSEGDGKAVDDDVSTDTHGEFKDNDYVKLLKQYTMMMIIVFISKLWKKKKKISTMPMTMMDQSIMIQ